MRITVSTLKDYLNQRKTTDEQKLTQMKEQLAKLKEQRSRLLGKGSSSTSDADSIKTNKDTGSVKNKLDLNGDGRITPLEALTYSRNGSVNSWYDSSQNYNGYSSLESYYLGMLGKSRSRR